MTDHELDEKFVRLTEPALGAGRVRALLAALGEPSAVISDLWALAAPDVAVTA